MARPTDTMDACSLGSSSAPVTMPPSVVARGVIGPCKTTYATSCLTPPPAPPRVHTSARTALTLGWEARTLSISESSTRKPRILTWESRRPKNSRDPSGPYLRVGYRVNRVDRTNRVIYSRIYTVLWSTNGIACIIAQKLRQQRLSGLFKSKPRKT